VEPLIAGSYDLVDVQTAFDAVQDGTLPGVAALIKYDEDPDRRRTHVITPRKPSGDTLGVSLVGFGNHALAQHVPNLQGMKGVSINGIASATGRNASAIGPKVGAKMISTDAREVIDDPGTDAVIICSGQPDHYEQLCMAIEAGKPALVEKPMVTRVDHFADVLRQMEDNQLLITVGLNRRYAPELQMLRDEIVGDIDSVNYTVTRPFLPPDHWSLDPIAGGGRLVSEGEHFVDVCNFLIGKRPMSVYARALGDMPEDLRTLCNYAVTLHYDGAVATIVFDESGAAEFPTERVMALAKGQVGTLDDFSKLTVHGRKVRKPGLNLGGTMGHKEQLTAFVDAVQGKPSPLLTWDQASHTTLTVFAAQESIASGEAIDLAEFKAALLASDDDVDVSDNTEADSED